MKIEINRLIKDLKMLVLDVDGVLTDGTIYKSESGEEILGFYVRDGMAIHHLLKNDIGVAIISGRLSGAMVSRAKELGIEEVHIGVENKANALKAVSEKTGVKFEEMAFLGDDLMDIPAMKLVGLPVAVADAAAEVKETASMVLKTPGGRGAVRELGEMILKAKDLWNR